jgi:hypothetical protein
LIYFSSATDARIAHFEKEREKENSERAVKINKLSYQQRMAVIEVNKLVDSILDIALYPDMGGIKMVSAYELQELSDAKDKLAFEFNL